MSLDKSIQNAIDEEVERRAKLVTEFIDSKPVQKALCYTLLNLAPFAHCFRDLGHDIEKAAEIEQGFMLTIIFKYIAKYGADWKVPFGDMMNEATTEVKRRFATELQPGKACSHAGCLSHVTHPCEGCGRTAGRWPVFEIKI